MVVERIPEIQKEMKGLVVKLRLAKHKRGKMIGEWVSKAKNPLMGFAYLFGKEHIRELGRPEIKNNLIFGGWRYFYFRDIKYRSKLRKIRDNISYLEENYNNLLGELKTLIS